MTEQNWRDLPAGRELDRLVAERVGYEIVEDFGMGGPSYTALLPGSVVMELPRAFGEDEAWEQVTPHYSTSVDAALTLPLREHGWTLKIVPDFSGGLVWATITGDEGLVVSVYVLPARLIAQAMCYAWLAWKDGTA